MRNIGVHRVMGAKVQFWVIFLVSWSTSCLKIADCTIKPTVRDHLLESYCKRKKKVNGKSTNSQMLTSWVQLHCSNIYIGDFIYCFFLCFVIITAPASSWHCSVVSTNPGSYYTEHINIYCKLPESGKWPIWGMWYRETSTLIFNMLQSEKALRLFWIVDQE